MSQENVEIVRDVYEAINRRDWDTMFRDSHPDLELTTQLGVTAGTRRGRRQVTEFLEDYVSAFDSLIWEPEQFFEGGDQVVAWVTTRSRFGGGDVDLVIRNGHLWTFRNGQWLSIKTFAKPGDALEAAGLSE